MYTLYVVLRRRLTFRVCFILWLGAYGWRIRYVAASRHTHTAEVRPGGGSSPSVCVESEMMSMSVCVSGLYSSCRTTQYLFH